MLNQSKEASRHVDAVLSALDILDCFQENPELTIKEIIETTGLTRSRVMRLLGTLAVRGYIVSNPENGTFHPGIKVAILARSFEKNNQIEVLVRPVLKQLAQDSGESSTFYVQDGQDRVVLAREEGKHRIRYVIPEGARFHLSRGGAAGKILLAFGPPELLEKVILASGKDGAIIASGVEAVRRQGCAVSRAENTPDARSIAAPVFKSEGKLAGALTISGPAIRMNEEQIQAWSGVVVETARFLSERLGGSRRSKRETGL